MTTHPRRDRRALRLIAGTAAALLACTPAAQAADGGPGATVEEFSNTATGSFETALPECFRSDLVGTLTFTETFTGQFVQNDGGVFTARGVGILDYRVEFPNGMYAFGTATSRFHFVASSVTVDGAAIKEPRTVYAVDGTPVAHIVIHAVVQLVYRDLNGDGQPQANEISANIEKLAYTCG
jgi:hypothetical protein